MKKNLLFNLLGLLLISFLFGCSDEENTDYGPYVDPNGQVLTVTQIGLTPSSFTFSVEASDPNIPYLALYVNKNVIDEVAKVDLPKYLMEEMQSQATATGVTIEEYLAKSSHLGNLESETITNLLPGEIYELVVFAYSGVKPANRAETMFFETPKVETVISPFTISKDFVSPYMALFNVTSSLTDTENVYYFPLLLSKAQYDYEIAHNYKDVILNNYFAEYWNFALEQQAVNGDSNKAWEFLFENGILIDNFENLRYVYLDPGTEYTLLLAAYKYIDKEPVLLTDVTTFEVQTENFELTSEFKGNIETVVNGTELGVTIKPGDDSMPYAFGILKGDFSDWESEMLMSTYLNDILENVGKVDMYEEEYTKTVANVLPGEKYTILAFSYIYGPYTKPKVQVVEVPNPDYETLNFQLSKFDNYPQTSYDFAYVVNPGDNINVPYYIEVSNEEVSSEDVSTVLNGYYKLYNANYGMTLSEFFYGSPDLGYTPDMLSICNGILALKTPKLQPGTYKVYCFPLQADIKNDEVVGIKVLEASILEETLEFAKEQAPKPTIKYFKSTDASEVFGKEYPMNQYMAVLDYEGTQAGISYGIVKDNTNLCVTMDDVDLVFNYGVKWNETNNNGLVFTMCGYSDTYYALSYKSVATLSTEVDREVILPITFGTKEELQTLYDKAFNKEVEYPFVLGARQSESQLMRKVVSPYIAPLKNEVKSEQADNKNYRSVNKSKIRFSNVGIANKKYMLR